MAGWYAVKRGITSHHLFKGNPQRLAVWMWLMDNVAWKDTTHDVKGHTVDVPRGSVCVSQRHIADECNLGHQVVRTALKRFESEHMVNTTPTHGKSVITLCNYEKYQDPESVANTGGNTTLTQPQHNPNTQKKQGNKGTREQVKKEPNGSSSFDAFWDVVPRKVGKGAARKAYDAALRKTDPQTIFTAMLTHADERQGKDAKYTPHPATWLNEERWEDDPPAPDDFHNHLSQALGGTNELPRTIDHHHSPDQRFPAALPSPGTPDHGSEPNRNPQYGGRSERAYRRLAGE